MLLRGRSLVVFSGLALGAICGSWTSSVFAAEGAGKDKVPYIGSGTKRMAARLAKIAEQAEEQPNENPYLSDKRAEALRSLLARISDPDKETEFRTYLGRELLFAGKTEEALKEFNAVEQRLKQSGKPVSPELESKITHFLGLSYLRLGEQQNCIQSHNPESCLLPIKGKGVHVIQRGSREAIKHFSAVLEENPDDLTAVWLLNIAYMTLGEHPEKIPEEWLISTDVFDSDRDIKRFPDIAAALGLDVDGLAGGGLMEDFDGDGYLDLMVSSWGLRDQLRYFRNNTDGSFSDRTEDAGLAGITGGLNLVHADYDNDGYSDVLVLRGAWLAEAGHHPNSLLRNNGDGTFDDVTEQAGLLSFHPTQTAAWGDYNNDGWLDLFIGNETTGEEEHPCELFHNNQDGTFNEIAVEVGVASVGYVKGVVWGDYDNDGRVDLYLSRLGQSNLLYRNDGPRRQVEEGGEGSPPEREEATSGTRPWSFTDVSVSAGVTRPRDSFPTWFWDYNNDGWLDLFVCGWRLEDLVGDIAADYLGYPNTGEPPRLYRNNGDGTFTDVAPEAQLNRLLLAMGSNFGDLDSDGFPDFYVATGTPDLALLIPNLMFRNADGKFFEDVTASGGFGHLQKGHGVSFGDIDNDGDQDISTVMGGAYSGDNYWNVLFLNPGNGNHWITLRLEGVESNRSAVGARIRIRLQVPDGERDVYANVGTGGSFGGSSLQQEIGLGEATSIDFIEIAWPSGKTQLLKDITMDQTLKIREGDGATVPVKLRRVDLEAAGGRAHSHDHQASEP